MCIYIYTCTRFWQSCLATPYVKRQMCIYTYICAYIYAYMYTHVARINTYVYTCIYMYTYIYVQIYVYMHICVFTYDVCIHKETNATWFIHVYMVDSLRQDSIICAGMTRFRFHMRCRLGVCVTRSNWGFIEDSDICDLFVLDKTHSYNIQRTHILLDSFGHDSHECTQRQNARETKYDRGTWHTWMIWGGYD